jgi:methylmalonyl-CoA carboxyltransferase large subunit
VARITTKDLAEILERVQAQLAALAERVERLETGMQPAQKDAAESAPATAEPVQTPPPPEPPKPELMEEELLAISAALAAYLGVRVRIKQIRLLGSHSWAQQGRVWIQASHKLH